MKQIIYDSDILKLVDDEDYRKEYEHFRRECDNEPDFELSDDDWWEYCGRERDIWLDDERCNLNKEIDGVIIAIADLGFWNGRCDGTQIIGHNIKDILYTDCDDAEWYGDGYNIHSTQYHHDGRNYITYRVVGSVEEAEKIQARVYNGASYADVYRSTRSLYPYIGDIYGWKTGRFHKNKKRLECTALDAI